jgi:pyruvate dehydrogenase E1 component beta subunit
MATMSYARAIEDAVGQAMAENDRIILLGEDTETFRRNLYVRFGPDRVLSTPISENAFLGAAVTAAMAGIRPLVDLTLIDFIGVAMDALLNHAAKVETFSGGHWQAPLVLWAACGGGYGDGGQHVQTLWGWLAHIPGLTVLVPSTPADAGNLIYTALHQEGPVIFLEHKLLADYWLDWLGGSKREGVNFDVPGDGAEGPVPKKWQHVKIGEAAIRRLGSDITIVTVGVGVHRSLEAAQLLEQDAIQVEVIDIRTIAPLDDQLISSSVSKTGRLLVVDEDYQGFGLSGEVAACVLEAGVSFSYRRVCTEQIIPYARALEYETLPNRERIIAAAKELMANS